MMLLGALAFCVWIGWMARGVSEDTRWNTYNHLEHRASLWRPPQWRFHRKMWGKQIYNYLDGDPDFDPRPAERPWLRRK